MNVSDVIAEIQSNPSSMPSYRYLVKHYEQLGLKNEAEAFRALIEAKLHGTNSPNRREKQQVDDSQDAGVSEADRN